MRQKYQKHTHEMQYYSGAEAREGHAIPEENGNFQKVTFHYFKQY